MIDIAPGRESELTELESFYSSVGYTGGVKPTDLVLLARQSGDLVGVVRLCEEEGHLVLRGMYVGLDCQRAGVGSRLLAEASATIGVRECWCVPYIHLDGFYGQAGFDEVAAADAPAFLVERSARYLAKGEKVMLMVRPRDWEGSAALGRSE